MNIKTIGVGPRLFNFDNDHSLLVLVKPFLLIGPVLKHPVLLCQKLFQDDWNKKTFYFQNAAFLRSLTFHFGLWTPERGFVGVGEILKAPI